MPLVGGWSTSWRRAFLSGVIRKMQWAAARTHPCMHGMAESTLLPHLVELGAVTEEEVSIDTLGSDYGRGGQSTVPVDVATQVCAWVRL